MATEPFPVPLCVSVPFIPLPKSNRPSDLAVLWSLHTLCRCRQTLKAQLLQQHQRVALKNCTTERRGGNTSSADWQRLSEVISNQQLSEKFAFFISIMISEVVDCRDPSTCISWVLHLYLFSWQAANNCYNSGQSITQSHYLSEVVQFQLLQYPPSANRGLCFLHQH